MKSLTITMDLLELVKTAGAEGAVKEFEALVTSANQYLIEKSSWDIKVARAKTSVRNGSYLEYDLDVLRDDLNHKGPRMDIPMKDIPNLLPSCKTPNGAEGLVRSCDGVKIVSANINISNDPKDPRRVISHSITPSTPNLRGDCVWHNSRNIPSINQEK